MDFKELYKENLTEEEFTSILEKVGQSASDKVRTEYSSKIKELEGKLPKEKTPEQQEMENKIKQLEQKEQELLFKENKLNISNALNEKGLPQQLADVLNIQGVEDINNFVQGISEIFNKHSIDNSYKPTHKHKANDSMSKEDFKKLGYTERVKLQETNPALYEKFASM